MKDVWIEIVCMIKLDLPDLLQDPTVLVNNYMSRRNEITNSDTHNRLRADLVEHIWAIHS